MRLPRVLIFLIATCISISVFCCYYVFLFEWLIATCISISVFYCYCVFLFEWLIATCVFGVLIRLLLIDHVASFLILFGRKR